MGLPRITYNGKTIDLPAAPKTLQVVPAPPRTINTTLSGLSETICQAHVDIAVHAEWPMMGWTSGALLKDQLENFIQWCLRGESWELTLDSAKLIDTVISVDATAGDTILYLEEPVGIAAGQSYKIIDGPHYLIVTVNSISGDQVAIASALDVDITAGAIFRDPFLFPGVIRDPGMFSPIQLVSAGTQVVWPPDRFILTMDFYEDTSQEDTLLFKNLAANVAGLDSASAQPWFPSAGAVAVAANTTYRMKGILRLSRSAGTVSHTTGLLFGGTASLTSIAYRAKVNTGDVVTNGIEDQAAIEVATLTVVKAASTSATEQTSIEIDGTIRINAAGTLIPEFQFSSAPGGIPSILAGSFFELTPLGSGGVTIQGTWS